MAVYLLSDELKSDLHYLIPPITKEEIIRCLNSLIYHLKFFGICYKSDIIHPSGSDYIKDTSISKICLVDHGLKVKELISNLKYLTLPLNMSDVVNQVNLIIEIFKTDANICSSYDFEQLRANIYKYSPSLDDKGAIFYINTNNNLSQKINKLSYLKFPLKNQDIINILNDIINLYKGNNSDKNIKIRDARIIDAQDYRALISALKEEADEEGLVDYGNASTKNATIDNYGNSGESNYEDQANFIVVNISLKKTSSQWMEIGTVDKINTFNNIPNYKDLKEGDLILLTGMITDLDYVSCKLYAEIIKKNALNSIQCKTISFY